MQITNSVVCGAIKGCTYKQIKSKLVGENAFPLTGFVCKGLTLHLVAAVGYGQLPDRSCLTHVFPRPSLGTRLLGRGK